MDSCSWFDFTISLLDPSPPRTLPERIGTGQPFASFHPAEGVVKETRSFGPSERRPDSEISDRASLPFYQASVARHGGLSAQTGPSISGGLLGQWNEQFQFPWFDARRDRAGRAENV